MSQQTVICSACNSNMVVHSRLNTVCDNPDCPGGRHFYYCGHCRKHSFSISKGSCVTKTCSTYGMLRKKCPECRLISVVSIDGTSFCLNRSCKSHADSITKCTTCGNKSLVQTPAFEVCIKSDCPTIMQPRMKTIAPQKPIDEGLGLSMFIPPAPENDEVGLDEAVQSELLVATAAVDENAPLIVGELEEAAAAYDGGDAPTRVAELSTGNDDPTRITNVNGDVVDAVDVEPAASSDPWGFDVEPTDARSTRLIRKTEEECEPVVLPDADPVSSENTLSPASVAISASELEAPVSSPEPAPVIEPAPIAPTPVTEPEPVPVVQSDPVLPTEKKPVPNLMAAFNKTPEPKPDSAPAIEEEVVPTNDFSSEPVEAAAGGVTRLSHRPEDIDSEIELAYEFLLQSLIEAEDGSVSPVILVFGLAGSGKSTYLTMLGDMLAKGQSKYHFPYEDVTTRSIQVDSLIDKYWGESASEEDREILRRRVRDLTFDYSSRNYEDYLMNSTWVPATVRESGNEAHAHSHFLATEILREGVTVGNIITMETSGEDFQELLGKIASLRSEKQLESALHRVLYKLLNRATGVLILVDPESADSDQQYHHIFRVFKESIEVRAAQALEAKVNVFANQDAELDAKSEEQINIDDAIALATSQENQDERHKQARQQLAEDLRELDQALTNAPASHAGVADVVAKHKRIIDELEAILRSVKPEFQQKADELFAEHGRTVVNFMQYYKSLIASYRDQAIFTVAVSARLKIRQTSRQERKDLIARVSASLGIKEPIHEAFLDQASRSDVSDRMRFLRYVSLVVTKSDRHPSVYPPEDYPKFKLPTCHVHIKTLESYTQLLDGFVNCYNTTAIGYSVQRGDQYAPGPGNSFTPVNIIEPLFDMLLHEERINGHDDEYDGDL